MTVQTTITRQDPEIEAYRLGLLSDVQGLIRNQMFGQQVQNLRSMGYDDATIAEMLSTEAQGTEGEEDYVPGVTYDADYIGGISRNAMFGPTNFEVAGFTRPQLDAIKLAEAGVGGYKPYLTTAMDQLSSGSDAVQEGISGLAGASTEFDPSGIASFMSPYEQEVIDRTIEDLEKNYERRENQRRQELAAEAISRGAFEGSALQKRAEAREFVPARERFERELGTTVAGLRRAGFQDAATRAQQAFEQAKRRQLTQASTTGQLGTGLAGMGIQSAGLGEAEQSMRGRDISTLMQVGGMGQALEQSALEAARLTNQQRYQQPFTQLGFLSDVYAGIPTSQSTQTMTTGSNASPFMQAASLGIAGLSAYGGAKQAGIL